MKYSIVFFGTSQFAVPILKKLHNHHAISAVVTQPDKPTGRKLELSPSPIRRAAMHLGIPVLQPEKVEEIKDQIKSLAPHFIITASYGKRIPESTIKIPSIASLNIHPSKLPKYRGATPIQSALLNGDTVTATTIIKMTDEIDAGDMVAQSNIDIAKNDTAITLSEKLSEESADILIELLEEYNTVKPQPQRQSDISLCLKIEKQDGQIDWKSQSADQIYNKCRAYAPWPGIFTFLQGKKFSIHQCRPEKEEVNEGEAPGKVAQRNNKTLVKTRDGWLELLEVQWEGKKKMTIRQFLNGHRFLSGSILG